MKLTYRIVLLILVIVSLSTIASFLLTQYQEETLHNDSEKILAFTITQSLRDTLVQDVINGNKLRVTELIRKLKEHDNPIEYIYVTHNGERIFAHSFSQGFPQYLISNASNHSHENHTGIKLSAKYQTQQGLIYEYSEPLIQGLGTTLHIGINQSEIAQTLSRNKQNILLMSLVIILLAIIFAYFWSKRITAPLSDLIDHIQRYGSGEAVNFDDLNINTPEIRLLASALQVAAKERQQAHSAILEREKDLEITLNSIGDAVIATDANGNITRMNPVASQLTGWSLDEARGLSVKSIFPIVNASTRLSIENPVEKVIATGETVYLSNHTTLISKDGTEYQIADSAAPIRNENNDILGMVLVFNDVTEQYKLREAIRESEKKYQTLAVVAPVGIYYTDKQGNCLYVNEKWSEITGLSSEEAAGDGWINSLHPDDKERVFAEWNKSATENTSFKCEYRFKHNEITRWVLGQALAETNDKAETIGYVGTITDITALKHAEDSAQASSQAMIDAQQLAHIGSWEMDLLTNKLQWSDEIYRIFEVDPEKFSASYDTFLNTIHPEDREKVNTEYTDAVNNKMPYSIVHRLLMPDGRIKHVHERCEVFYDKQEKPIRSTGTVQDITEQVNMEESLRRTEKMDALGKLTGGIAHDYNNMLGVILGYADLLESMLGDQPKLANYVSKIRHAGERGANLTTKLLSFSRQKASNDQVLFINELLHEEQHMLEKTLTARIKLIFDLEDGLWPVMLDSNQLEDAIVNLSINASHAIQGNGQLTIKTRNKQIDDTHAHLIQLPEGDYVQLSITDSGCGMDQSTKERIFEPFYSTKGEKGTGLGLSQVYGFVESSYGAIQVQSELSKGTEFIFYFPRHSQTNDVEKTLKEDTAPNEKGHESILIVDDEASLLNLSREILENQGYQIYCAENAKQALDILMHHPIDLMLSDIIMPDMDGYKLSELVREKYPSIKIQLTSGFSDDRHTSPSDIELYKDLLNKPYRPAILLKRIHELLNQKT